MRFIYYTIKFIICFSLYIAIFFMFPEIAEKADELYAGAANTITALKTEIAERRAKNEIERTPEPKEETLTAKTDPNGDIILPGNFVNIHYYNQSDERWGNEMYGPDNPISIYGCGPTTLAMLVTSLTGNEINPYDMAKWSYDNGYFCQDSGSYHSIIPGGASQWGLTVEAVKDYSPENIQMLLSTGNLIVVLMGNGHFTENGHFILIRGITLDGKFLIADSKSYENSQKEWEPLTIIDEAKYGASSNGPIWAVRYEK